MTDVPAPAAVRRIVLYVSTYRRAELFVCVWASTALALNTLLVFSAWVFAFTRYALPPYAELVVGAGGSTSATVGAIKVPVSAHHIAPVGVWCVSLGDAVRSIIPEPSFARDTIVTETPELDSEFIEVAPVAAPATVVAVSGRYAYLVAFEVGTLADAVVAGAVHIFASPAAFTAVVVVVSDQPAGRPSIRLVADDTLSFACVEVAPLVVQWILEALALVANALGAGGATVAARATVIFVTGDTRAIAHDAVIVTCAVAILAICPDGACVAALAAVVVVVPLQVYAAVTTECAAQILLTSAASLDAALEPAAFVFTGAAVVGVDVEVDAYFTYSLTLTLTFTTESISLTTEAETGPTVAVTVDADKIRVTLVSALAAISAISPEVEPLVHLPVAIVVFFVARFTGFGMNSTHGIIAIVPTADDGGVPIFVSVERSERARARCRFAGTHLARIVRHAVRVIAARRWRHTATLGRSADLACAASGVCWYVHTLVVRASILGTLELVRTGERRAG